MFKELIQNIFSRLKKFRVNKLILLLFAVALCAIALAFVICYIISTAHPPVNIAVDFQLIENFGRQDAIWPAVISAAGGLLSSVIGSNSQSSANRMNYYMMQEQNKFNSLEAQKLRDWQNSQWWSQFNAENAYNDPKNQMARMSAAGINPFIAAENSSKVGTTAANPAVPASAAAQAASYHPAISTWSSSQFPQNLSAIVGAFKSLAEARKVGVDTDLLRDTYDDLVKQVSANLKSTELLNKFQEIQNQFEPLVKKYGLQKSWADYLKALSEKDVNVQRVQEVFQNSLSLAEQRAKTKAEREQVEKLTPVLVEQNKELTNLYKEKQETERHTQHNLDTSSQANQALAFKSIQEGNLAIAQCKTEDDLRESVVRLRKAEFKLKESEAFRTLYEVFDKAVRLGFDKDRLEYYKKQVTWLIERGKIQTSMELADLLTPMLGGFDSARKGANSVIQALPVIGTAP